MLRIKSDEFDPNEWSETANASPLIVAAGEGKEDALHEILLKNPDLEMGKDLGGTAIFFAVLRGKTKCIEMLIEA